MGTVIYEYLRHDSSHHENMMGSVPENNQEMQPVTRCPPATDTRCLLLGSAISAPRMRTLLPDLPGLTIKANLSSRQRLVVHPG